MVKKSFSSAVGMLALLLVATLTLVACGSKAEEAGPPPEQETQAGEELTPLEPFTGKPMKGKLPSYPPLVVKIDNTSNARPQAGLSAADLVVEQLVEGGMTRLAAVYYSQLPPVVAPVRSARATDIGIVGPTGGVLIASGAAPGTNYRLANTNIATKMEGSTGFFRDSSRRAPYNLAVRLPDLAKTLSAGDGIPRAYLPWGDEDDFTGARAAVDIELRYSPGSASVWSYNAKSGRYVQANSYAAADDLFHPHALLALRVKKGDAGYRDPGGNPVPESIFYGKGNFQLFYGGQMLRGSWKKPKRHDDLQLTTNGGAVKVPAGNVWIGLVPTDQGGGSVSFSAPSAADSDD